MSESFTVDEWCRHRKLSRAMFYKMQKLGLAPLTYYVGNRQRISPEADRAWIAAREAASQPAEVA